MWAIVKYMYMQFESWFAICACASCDSHTPFIGIAPTPLSLKLSAEVAEAYHRTHSVVDMWCMQHTSILYINDVLRKRKRKGGTEEREGLL